MRRHLVRLQPDPHRERARAEDVGALHAADGAQLGLDDARQVVGDLVLIEIGGREAEVDRRELVVRRFQLDDRRFRLRRQIVAHLRDLRLNLRERRVGVVIELQVHGNRAEPLRARRFHVVDAVGAGDDALERRRDESRARDPRSRRRTAVETRTTAMSLRGYCRTLSARIDCRPAIRMTRLTTIARTGRLTNRSVNFISCSPASASGCWPAAPCC